MTALAVDSPDFKVAAYVAQRDERQLVDDCWIGTKAIVAAGPKYTTRSPLEQDPTYTARLKRGRFYNIYRQSVVGLASIITHRPITLNGDTDPTIREDCDDIDGQGNNLPVFFNRLIAAAIHGGFASILVEYPEVPDAKGLNAGQEKTLGLRPYWVLVRSSEITNWRITRVGGFLRPGKITITQTVTVPEGEFGEKEVEQFRVLERMEVAPGFSMVAWRLYERRIVEGVNQCVEIRNGIYGNISEIPLATLYAGDREGFFVARPAMYDIAETNLDYWNVRSDHLAALHSTGVAVPVMTGLTDEQKKQVVEHGPDIGLFLPPGGTFSFAETTGSGLASSRAELQDLLGQAANQGVAFMAPEGGQPKTATGERIDDSQQASRAARIAGAGQDVVEEAMVFHAQFRKLKPGRVTVPMSLSSLTLDANELATMNAIVVGGNLSRMTFWEMMVKAGRLPENFDPAVEIARIEDERGPAPPEAGDGDILNEPPGPDPDDPLTDPLDLQFRELERKIRERDAKRAQKAPAEQLDAAA